MQKFLKVSHSFFFYFQKRFAQKCLVQFSANEISIQWRRERRCQYVPSPSEIRKIVGKTGYLQALYTAGEERDPRNISYKFGKCQFYIEISYQNLLQNFFIFGPKSNFPQK